MSTTPCNGLYRYEVKLYQVLDCHRGGQPRYKKEIEDPLLRRNAPGSRKCGCPATMKIRVLQTNTEHILEISLPAVEVRVPLVLVPIFYSTKHHDNCMQVQIQHHSTLLHIQAHTGHESTSLADMLCFRPLSEVEDKVKELITDVHLNRVGLKVVLDHWIENELIPQHIRKGVISDRPHPFNRAYFPTKRDIQNLVHGSILNQRNSLFDQVSGTYKRYKLLYFF